MIRLLVPQAHEGEVSVEGAQLRYLAQVLRLKVGDGLEVFDGNGNSYDGTLIRLGESAGVLTLSGGRASAPARAVTVVQGLPKAEKLEWVLQKGTELGASAFAPVGCARSVVKLDGKEDAKRARWQRIVEEAARQCGRSEVPEVFAPRSLPQAVTALGNETAVLILDEEERGLRLSTALAGLAHRPLALVVGPEGGLTREEVSGLVAQGATRVTLGRLILRTETAALAALIVVRHLDGELG